MRRILTFQSTGDWERWLAKNHATSDGIWLRIYRRSSGVKGITYEEALDEALCYGWIDGQSKSHDEKSWLRKFTPRRAKSIWSKGNIAHVARLMKAKRMKSAGLKEVEAAKADGRWAKAYDSPKTMPMPEDFLKRLAKSKMAEAFFKNLNRADAYAIAWPLHSAKKPETRERRMKKFLEMMAKGAKLHP